jgi:nucleotide-binding universal stress UspA family protein
VTVNPVGLAVAFTVLGAVAATFYWMLHPPVTEAERAASKTEEDIAELIGSVIVVFSQEIHSENMMALTARLARRVRARLLAIYIIEVPHQLPVDAEMEKERRAALDVLARAEAIARKQNVEIATEIIPARQVSQGVLDLVKRRDVHLIVLGSYREGKYTDAPLGRSIEVIAAKAPCDVLIGVQGVRGRMLATSMDLAKQPPESNGGS